MNPICKTRNCEYLLPGLCHFDWCVCWNPQHFPNRLEMAARAVMLSFASGVTAITLPFACVQHKQIFKAVAFVDLVNKLQWDRKKISGWRDKMSWNEQRGSVEEPDSLDFTELLPKTMFLFKHHMTSSASYEEIYFLLSLWTTNAIKKQLPTFCTCILHVFVTIFAVLRPHFQFQLRK